MIPIIWGRSGESAALAGRRSVNREALTADELQRRHLGDVFRYVSRRIPQREEAEDVTAEVFAAAFQQLHRFSGKVEPRLWLLGIARRKTADWYRKHSRGAETCIESLPELPAPSSDEPEARYAQEEARKTIRLLVYSMKDDHREALILHYADGLTAAEVGAVMGKSPQAVHSLLQRARAAVYRSGSKYFVEESEASK